jgi:hypothetical protein
MAPGARKAATRRRPARLDGRAEALLARLRDALELPAAGAVPPMLARVLVAQPRARTPEVRLLVAVPVQHRLVRPKP